MGSLISKVLDILLLPLRVLMGENRAGLMRTGLFAVAWLFALLFSLSAENPENLVQYEHKDYDHSNAVFGFWQLGFLLSDLFVHYMQKNREKPHEQLNIVRELLIIAGAACGLIGFVFGMHRLGDRHSFTIEDVNEHSENATGLRNAIAAYSYLATAILGFTRVFNIDADHHRTPLGGDKNEEMKTSSVGAKYSRVPEMEAYNFY